MSWYGDPDALEAAARRLAADAGAVRERAGALARSLGSLPWQGLAADAFRRTLGEDTQAMERSARELDEAAAELRAHAAEVRDRLAQLRALEDAVTGWVGDRLEALR